MKGAMGARRAVASSRRLALAVDFSVFREQTGAAMV